MFSPADFWLAMIVACIIWFSTVTVYVAIRGAMDIRQMLKRLEQRHQEQKRAEDSSP